MAITYNVLNLQQSLSQNGTTVASYTWLADGTKCAVVDNTTNGYDYLGSLIYNRSGSVRTLESAAFGGGRFVNTNNTILPYYYITDQLGSTRVITDNSGSVVERNDYYPFGGKHANSGYAQLTTNKQKFNGKELQTTGNTGFLDYGARMYDDVIGRWSVVDPLAEKRQGLSPYNFVQNNPLAKIDPNGMLDDNITALQNGTIEVQTTNDKFDRFYVENNDGSRSQVATLDKYKASDGKTDLVTFPEKGQGFNRYSNKDLGGDHSVQPLVAAALFGAIAQTTELLPNVTVQLGDMSTTTGGKPGNEHNGGEKSHINGRNVDVRYISNNNELRPLTINSNQFDKDANQIMVNNFFKFGFKNILSQRNSAGFLLNNTSNKGHYNHLHLQGFNPIFKIIK